MKKNLNVGGLREGNDLRVCRQSSKISKSSCFQVKISQQGALLESSIQNHQDGEHLFFWKYPIRESFCLCITSASKKFQGVQKINPIFYLAFLVTCRVL